MPISKPTFLRFVNELLDSEKYIEFGHIIRNFFYQSYPDVKSTLVNFTYAPDCYHPLDETERCMTYTNMLKSANREEFTAVGDLFIYKSIRVAPIVEFNNRIKYLLVFGDCSEDKFEDIVSYITEINTLYRICSLQVDSGLKFVNSQNTTLISRIAHDINSLIALIPKEVAENDVLKNRITYSESLSSEIMNYLREMDIEKSTVPVKDLISGIISSIEFPSSVTMTEVYKNIPEHVCVDVELLDYAFSAIIMNSVFAAQIEGGIVEMIVGSRKNNSPFIDHDWLEVVISDSGPGIPSEFLQNVKNPLFTTWKDHGHVGLGLSIANGIIKTHDGLLSIESEADQGTRVTIHIPMGSYDEKE